VIIDLKSDHITEYPDDFLMTKYNAQLYLYALMLSRRSNLEVAKTGVYFIRNGLLIEQSVDEPIIQRTENHLKQMILELSQTD